MRRLASMGQFLEQLLPGTKKHPPDWQTEAQEISNLGRRPCILHGSTMFHSVTLATLGAAMAVSVALAQSKPPKVILLVGPPGSGKTTQAKFLAKKYSVPAISMSDLLKKLASGKKDPVSKGLATGVASGDLLPDEAAADLVRQAIFHAETKGFILDGFPSTAGQAKALDRILAEHRLPKAVVVVLDAPDDVIRKRMMARRRADDKPEIIDRRIREFRNEAALLAGWAGQTRVVRVDATASIADVSKQIVSGLESAWSNQTP
jgi:adenylate kinase